ncbi:hypothetical protein Plim_2422 [Planctopirus limnophila DSM 3776]|uniref:Uncharacterized protein n=1 Tax=Planctopirus limnophila (strain ATCC 43296 / DSM 3776 / IFAM 1008 / Mu 290) TaxID=521674 RepID=D5SPA4_PLAL2|nr:hypothetical protein [Planctopirus limnophila]ADG68248.1 hypothetical protein Plim_2422 [Planctopirus limnophila DSM 3776]
MTTIINDPEMARRLIRQRRAREIICETAGLKISLRANTTRRLLCLRSLQTGEEWTD